jgi:iron complex outermembrane receptor protein
VQVLIDGAPVGSSLAGLVDLGSIPLDGLDRAEIHRGYVPIEYGGATIGGAINLVSRRVSSTPTLRARGGIGSFGAREGRAGVDVPLAPRLGLSAQVGYAGAAGNFPFYDIADTPLVADDDTTTLRRNNAYDRVMAQVRVDGERDQWRWSVRPLATWKHQGIPGVATAQSTRTELDTFDARTILRAERRRFGHPGGRLTWVASAGAQRRLYSDPQSEVGLGVDDQRTISADVYVSPRLRLALWRGAFLRLAADQRFEEIWVDERAVDDAQAMESSGDARRLRLAWGVGLALEQFVFGGRWSIVPAVRVDGIDSRFAVPAGEGEQDDQGRDDVQLGLSPRLGTRVRVIEGLSVRASGGRYFRPPTLLELFGDRGYVLGNEGLVPERGTSVDGGLVYDRELEPEHGGPVAVYAQVAGFATWTEDIIQWVQTGSVVQPINIARARVAGVESSIAFSAWRRALVLSANYTWLDSRNRGDDPAQRDAPLPGRPRHEAFARVSGGWEWAPRGFEIEPRLLYTVDLASGTFLDPSARYEIPTRVIHGLGAELHLRRRIHVGCEVRNLVDTRVTTWTPPVGSVGELPVPLADFIGYPLPGRSVWATVRIELGLSPRKAVPS